MLPSEFRALAVQIVGERGWQTRIAERLEVDGSTVRRWISGAVPIPRTAAVALNALAQDHQEAPSDEEIRLALEEDMKRFGDVGNSWSARRAAIYRAVLTRLGLDGRTFRPTTGKELQQQLRDARDGDIFLLTRTLAVPGGLELPAARITITSDPLARRPTKA